MPNGNLLTTLKLIRKAEQITRQDLASKMGLSISMLSKLTGVLLEQGVIRETGRTETESRRSSGLLAINADAGYAIGLDVNGHHQKAVLVGLDGGVVCRIGRDTSIPPDREAILDELESVVAELVRSAAISPERILGAGLGLWGSVNPISGVVASWTETPNLSETWRDFAIRDALLERWPFPHIIVDDIVRCLGIAEVHFGDHTDAGEGFIYLLADSGIGMVLMLNEMPFVGALQIAGEIGHIPLRGLARPCNCGNVGCLETGASATAILEGITERLRDTQIQSQLRERILSMKDVLKAAGEGDKLAYRALIEAGEYLGEGLAITVNLFGPALIVIGGMLSASDAYLDAARRSLRLQVINTVASRVRVEASRLDQWAGARGAAAQVLGRLFTPGSTNILGLTLERQS